MQITGSHCVDHVLVKPLQPNFMLLCLVLITELETLLKEADATGARMKLIVTDGVFSMDGNVAPLR